MPWAIREAPLRYRLFRKFGNPHWRAALGVAAMAIIPRPLFDPAHGWRLVSRRAA